MTILFRTTKLKKKCNDHTLCKKEYGKSADRIMNSLDDLLAANTLAIFATIPQHRCHELTGKRQGQLAIDLVHPLRLVFEPADDPPAQKEDGGIDWDQVKTIRILEITDYH